MNIQFAVSDSAANFNPRTVDMGVVTPSHQPRPIPRSPPKPLFPRGISANSGRVEKRRSDRPGNGGRNGGSGRWGGPVPTADELDKEMAAYNKERDEAAGKNKMEF